MAVAEEWLNSDAMVIASASGSLQPTSPWLTTGAERCCQASRGLADSPLFEFLISMSFTDASGVVPGGPADKYDQAHASDQRIEAHDTILQVDGEVATEANILRLLRGDGKVGGSAVIVVQKFHPSPLSSAVSTERISESSIRDPVEVTLYRDYKWWVEGMRDVAVAVEQVSNDMGASSARSNDEGLMHTVWQMEVNKQLRKLSKLSAASQQNLRNHIEALEDALSSALGNANSETIAVEKQLSLERDELRARLESTQKLLREQELERELEKRRSSGGGGDAVVVERYREMIGALQHDLQALSRHPPPPVPLLLHDATVCECVSKGFEVSESRHERICKARCDNVVKSPDRNVIT